MGLNLKTLSIRNFMSFGNQDTVIDLSVPGTTHLLGENLDTLSNNGVGKTTILNAISYALYNKALSNISKEKLINRTNSDIHDTTMEVVLTIDRDGTEYEISRSRGTSYAIKIVKNGDFENPITPDSVSNADKLIEEIAGISYELFRRTVVFSGGDQSFFEMPGGIQRNVIEELLKITELSKKSIKLKKHIQDTESSIKIQEAVIVQQESASSLYKKQVSDAEKRTLVWEDKRVSKMQDIEQQLISIEGIDLVKEQLVHNKLNESINVKKEIDISLASEHRIVNRYKKELTKTQGELVHLKDKKCPFCLQKFENAEDKIVELNDKLIDINSKMNISKEIIDESDNELILIENDIKEAKSNITYDNIESLIKTKADSDNLIIRLNELKDGINPHIDALDSLISAGEVEVEYGLLDELKREYEHQKFLLKLLTDKNSFIRKKIINRNIPSLNIKLQEYIRDLGLLHKVKFTPDLKCVITEHSRELDYGNLSGGEKKRLNLALSLAFRDVLHNLHSSINILFTDEIDGGAIDESGVDNIVRIIKRKAIDDDIGIWIISHRPEIQGKCDRELKIVKENGFSRIVD